ncbi:MAG: glucose 1-dehydrogenase [Acidimicrobiia bacterium]|nr:glucose 1-dehydrogenase [Acidimicrobiia bacterium]
MTVEGKRVLITGAAQGIGRSIAERLAAEGAAVCVADLNADGAAQVAANIRESGGRAASVGGNVAERADICAMIDSCVSELGGLDVMFNNAGFNKPQPFLEVTEEVWHQVMNVNALGVLMGTQEAAKAMIAQGTGGKIINTASIAGREGFPSFVPYCVSKFGVVAITQGAARALAEHDITVNAFAPGVVATPLWEQLDLDLMEIGDSEQPGQAMQDFSAGILKGRAADPADIAGTARFLASADSDYMTAQVIMIDGGMVLV